MCGAEGHETHTFEACHFISMHSHCVWLCRGREGEIDSLHCHQVQQHWSTGMYPSCVFVFVLSVCIYVWLCVCLCVRVCVCVCVCVSVSLWVRQFVFLNPRMSVSVYVSVCLSVCLRLYLCVCLSLCFCDCIYVQLPLIYLCMCEYLETDYGYAVTSLGESPSFHRVPFF